MAGRLLVSLVAVLFAVAGSFLAASAGGAVALRAASDSRLDVDLSSALRADYSADPDRPKLAPLDPEIIPVAAADELALSTPDDPADSSEDQALPPPAPTRPVAPTGTPTPVLTPTPARGGQPAEPGGGQGGGQPAEPGGGQPDEPGGGQGGVQPDKPGGGQPVEPGGGQGGVQPDKPGGGQPAEPGGGQPAGAAARATSRWRSSNDSSSRAGAR